MKYLILNSILAALLMSCAKDKSVEPKNLNWCATTISLDSFFHKTSIKMQVEGNSSPDSVDFMSHTAYTIYGSRYFKRFYNPTLTLKDSTLMISQQGADLSIIIYSADTTKIFTSKIFINDSIRLKQTGQTHSGNKKFITTYVF